jgi:Leucine-rich repeat (LRR) protein
LQELNLDSNSLITLPDEIGKLVRLQTLRLNYNNLTSLPAEIGKLINLKELDLGSNSLTSLPVEIGRLCNLQKLYLSKNNLTSLPAEIGGLVNLKELFLNYNSLISLPHALVLGGCYDCPVEIGRLCNLINLEELYLDESSYEINNLDPDCPILILGAILNPITNLPCGLKNIYLSKSIDISMIKLPFGCEINYDLDEILR